MATALERYVHRRTRGIVAMQAPGTLSVITCAKKALEHMRLRGSISCDGTRAQRVRGTSQSIFFHPDRTVGSGLSPNQPQAAWHAKQPGLAGSTAGGESRPVLKIYVAGVWHWRRGVSTSGWG